MAPNLLKPPPLPTVIIICVIDRQEEGGNRSLGLYDVSSGLRSAIKSKGHIEIEPLF